MLEGSDAVIQVDDQQYQGNEWQREATRSHRGAVATNL
jgi:hypothetical protein